MKYKPDLTLMESWDGAAPMAENGIAPAMAVFKKDSKTFVYIGTAHGLDESFDAINYCFEKYKFDALVTEFENSGRELNGFMWNELAYSAGVAATLDIPVIFGDASAIDIIEKLIAVNPENFKTYQMDVILYFSEYFEQQTGRKWNLQELIEYFKDKKYKPGMPPVMNEGECRKWLMDKLGWDIDTAFEMIKKHPEYFYPKPAGTIFNVFHDDTNKLVRDPFMIENIFATINKYDTVLATFGEGHYRSIRKILETAFGKPEIISEFPKSEKINIPDNIKPKVINPLK